MPIRAHKIADPITTAADVMKTACRAVIETKIMIVRIC